MHEPTSRRLEELAAKSSTEDIAPAAGHADLIRSGIKDINSRVDMLKAK